MPKPIPPEGVIVDVQCLPQGFRPIRLHEAPESDCGYAISFDPLQPAFPPESPVEEQNTLRGTSRE